MADPLRAVLAVTEHPRPAVTAADARWWPRWAVPALERAGVLAPDTPAWCAECEECGEGHVESVTAVDTPGRPRRWFHPCPTVGRAEVREDRLRRWAVRVAAFGAMIADRDAVERTPGRVWELGPLAAGGGVRVGWLVAGWRGEEGLADRVPELAQPNAAVFVPATLPPAGVWGRSAPRVVVPLAAVLTLTARGLAVDPVALAAHLGPPWRGDAADRPVVVVSPSSGPPPPLVPLPPGTEWEGVSLEVGDFALTVRAGGVERAVGYEAIGLVDRRTRAPDGAWKALALLAAAGELAPPDRTRTKSGTLKNHLTRLRAALRRLTGLGGDPFHRTGRLRPYRPRFRVRPSV